MKEIKRVVLSGGGTGGHIYPALALLKRMQQKYPNLECLYIGSAKGLEARIVAQAGIRFESVEVQGFKRSLSPENLKTLWLATTSVPKSMRLLKAFQPDVVIGTGGYVCGPVLLAATLLKIPTLIHEQNSVAGVTNRLLRNRVNLIATCFEEVAPYFAPATDKIRLTGNPRGQEVVETPQVDQFLETHYQFSSEKPTVLIFGGSRGAPAINRAALDAIEQFGNKDYQVIIATGQAHFDTLASELTELPANVRVVPYVDNMPTLLRSVQLVVCRSGATTLTELTALGLPSILIPSPYVTANHQEHNALALVNRQAALMIREKELTVAQLVDNIDQLLLSPETLANMAQAAKALGITDASTRIIEAIETIL
ncbi:MAG: undecaprenyldiphospho-muramoylpentapeptide beta-N-acetylglucosaminyltransferase [Aerococcaceae bacterium]|nr:undecaprenyldiphospho-muramoylpentapeptide beta-N-acetylglucosaminyltransferase [Aerococcaceae bacterium]